MDVLERLREGTRGAHDRLEAAAMSGRIMDGSLGAEEYKQLIQVHYIVHRELEALLEEKKVEEHFPELHMKEREKMPLLKKDVEELAINREKLNAPAAGQLPQLEEPYGPLGCIYVMEGATLGGMVIVKSLRKNEQLAGIDNFHYFGCYGSGTSRQWKSFLEVLKEKGQGEEAKEQIVKAARMTYEFFEANFKKIL